MLPHVLSGIDPGLNPALLTGLRIMLIGLLAWLALVSAHKLLPKETNA